MRALVGCRVIALVTERDLLREYFSLMVKDVLSNLCVKVMLNKTSRFVNINNY